MGATGIALIISKIIMSLTFLGLWIWSLIHCIQSTKSTELNTAAFASP